MYVLNISYTQPSAQVQPYVPAHSAWVKDQLERGVFLAAGPKKDGHGGIIFAKSIPAAELHKLIADDVYVQAEVARYQIAEFDCRLTAASLIAMSGA